MRTPARRPAWTGSSSWPPCSPPRPPRRRAPLWTVMRRRRRRHAPLGKVLVLHVFCPPSRVAIKGVEVLLPREYVAAADDGAAEGDGCRAADGWQATEEYSKKEKPARHPAVRTQLPKPPHRRTAAELRRQRHSERPVGEAFLLLLTATRSHRDSPPAGLAAGRHLSPVWSTVVRRCAATGSTRRASEVLPELAAAFIYWISVNPAT